MTGITVTAWTYDVIHVALDGKEEAGRVLVRDQLTSGYWYIHGLYVKPEYRGLGVGRQLMTDVLNAHLFSRIELIPAPAGDTGLDAGQLTAWMRRLGFTPGPSANTRRPARESDTIRMIRPAAR